jgi:hypothetical protein
MRLAARIRAFIGAGPGVWASAAGTLLKMESERPAEPGSPAFRCVVWHAPGSVVPADLTAALGRRQMAIDHCCGPFAALAEVCALDREMHDASHHGAGGVILVLVQAEALDDAAGVVRAVELYAPRVRCWRYEPAAAERLRAIGSADLAPAMPAVIVMPEARRAEQASRPGAVRHPAQGRATLRLAGEGTLPPRSQPEGAQADEVREQPREGSNGDEAGASHQVLTPEELSMLLSEDIVDTDGRSGRVPEKRAGDSQ